jgi:hypothetical protein
MEGGSGAVAATAAAVGRPADREDRASRPASVRPRFWEVRDRSS